MAQVEVVDNETSLSRHDDIYYCTLGIVALGGILGGTIIGNHVGHDQLEEVTHKDIPAQQKIVDQDQGKLLSTIYDNDNKPMTLQLSEGCVKLFKPYLSEGALVKASEDSAVSDVVHNPTQACGTDPTNIRTNLKKLRGGDAAVNLFKSVFLHDRKKLRSYQNRAHDHLTVHKTEFSGLLIGTVFGIAGGSVAAEITLEELYPTLHRKWAFRKQKKYSDN